MRLFSSLNPQLPQLDGSPLNRVLDLGCGDRPAFADRKLGNIEIGADLEVVCTRFPFVACEGSRLPFADAAFDLVISRVTIPYLNIPASLREICRVLVPGGRVWATLHLPRMAWKRIQAAAFRRDFVDAIFQSYALLNCALLTAAPVELPWLKGNFESVQTPLGITRSLKRAGFESIDTEICPAENNRRHFAVSAVKPHFRIPSKQSL